MSFGSIAPLLALGFVIVMIVGIAVRLAMAVRARTTRAGTDPESDALR